MQTTEVGIREFLEKLANHLSGELAALTAMLAPDAR